MGQICAKPASASGTNSDISLNPPIRHAEENPGWRSRVFQGGADVRVLLGGIR